MLPLLINDIFIRPSQRFGIAIGRLGVCIASSGNTYELHEASFSQAIYGNNSIFDFRGELARILSSTINTSELKTIEVNLVVPDTIIRSSIFELESIPRNQKSFDDLIKWKMSQLLGRDEMLLECRSQYIGDFNGNKYVYAQAADSVWLNHMRSAIRESGIHAWGINPASFYQYNTLSDNLPLKSSALLSIESDYWTLQLCDEKGLLRSIVTRLSRVAADATETSYIANETIRTINGFENSSHISIKSIYVAGIYDLSINTAAELSDKLNNKSVHIAATNMLSKVEFTDSHQLANLAMVAIA